MASKNLSIMLTDVKGYSQLTSNSSRKDLALFIKIHNNVLIPIIGFYKGTIVKSLGDSLLCTFDSATSAAVCAIAIQALVGEYNKSQEEESKRLLIRVIINTGDVSISDNDIFGEAVNTVSAMEKLPLFKEGGIGISEGTYLMINKNEIHANEEGVFEVKGLKEKLKIYTLPMDKQNLSELPTNLIDLMKKVAEGKEVLKELRELRKENRKSMTLSFYALGTIIVLVLIVITTLFIRHGGKNENLGELESLLKDSDPDQNLIILKKEFVGDPKLFDEIDSDKDDQITPVEIQKYSKQKNIEIIPEH